MEAPKDDCGGVNMDKYISEYSDDEIVYEHCIIKHPDEDIFRFHTHDICEIIFLKDGDVSAIIGEKTYKLKKDSLVFFRPNVPHAIRIDSPCTYDRHDILFDESTLANGVFHRIPKELDIIDCKGNKQIINLFEKLDYYYKNFEGLDLKNLVTNITEELLFNLSVVPTDDFYGSIITTHPIIKDAIEYINMHYTEPITIDDISREMCITKSYLHRLFIENLKISPKKYINMRRLSKAQKLIKTGQAPSAIYTDCGFSEYTTFFRNYTAYFGYNPSEKDRITVERKIES